MERKPQIYFLPLLNVDNNFLILISQLFSLQLWKRYFISDIFSQNVRFFKYFLILKEKSTSKARDIYLVTIWKHH